MCRGELTVLSFCSCSEPLLRKLTKDMRMYVQR